MRARSSSVAVFASLSFLAFTVGCGGKTDDGTQGVQDSGVADTGESDTGAPDTGTPDTGTPDTGAPDTGSVSDADQGYDVPGSLFDADIPDITFDNGTTAAGCVDCLKTKCQSQLATCDADPRCRGLTLCVLETCQGAGDTGCLFGCADDYGVTGFNDPIIGEAQGILNCETKNCDAECPNVSAQADSGTSTDGGSASDGGAAPDAPGAAKMYERAHLGEVLASFAERVGGNAAARNLCVDTFSH